MIFTIFGMLGLVVFIAFMVIMCIYFKKKYFVKSDSVESYENNHGKNTQKNIKNVRFVSESKNDEVQNDNFSSKSSDYFLVPRVFTNHMSRAKK